MKDASAVIDCQGRVTYLKVGDEETWVALHEGIYPPSNIRGNSRPRDTDAVRSLVISLQSYPLIIRITFDVSWNPNPRHGHNQNWGDVRPSNTKSTLDPPNQLR